MKTIKDRPRVDFTETETTGNTAIDYCEEHYPETTNLYKDIMQKQYELFCKKQKNYGPSNISVGTNLETDDEIKLSLTGLWFRMNDKIQRMKNLLMNNQKANNEPLEDSFLDVSNYGIMSTIVNNKKWGKQNDNTTSGSRVREY